MDVHPEMTRRLHLVFGGELIEPNAARFRDLDKVEVIGLFPDYESARAAWKEASQRTVDNALMRYFIARLSRIEDCPASEFDGADSPPENGGA